MQQWTNRIEAITAKFQEAFGGLTPEELNWKPNPSTWSIAQNVDHLIVINRTYFPGLASLKSGKVQLPVTARFGFLVAFFGKTVLKAVNPDRKKKMKTFSIWEPAQSEVGADILERFTAHQAELQQEMAAAANLIARGAVISSPANKYIVYKLETAFEIIVQHEERHLAQAKEILEMIQ